MKPSYSTNILAKEVSGDLIGDVVTPDCSGGTGTPKGWGSLTSTASRVSGGSYTNYFKKGDYNQALRDFNTYLGSNYNSIPFSSGTGYYVTTPYGNVNLYRSSTSLGGPSIKWSNGKEVMRYE
ncbi:hypothetical protein LCM10_04265 [Rossellomorea aquimaris]|uniref:hypothetical protein n=1 Tax=Rossellomorea aquimaris TaxID=189382 RepID=UPI001CD2627E|nr:hypothetical protein [Rossellomorea aquimaris]MCA1054191.1 hypothetical protein [Rossellomorea aquimaris]